jgi:hypothetical protein
MTQSYRDPRRFASRSMRWTTTSASIPGNGFPSSRAARRCVAAHCLATARAAAKPPQLTQRAIRAAGADDRGEPRGRHRRGGDRRAGLRAACGGDARRVTGAAVARRRASRDVDASGCIDVTRCRYSTAWSASGGDGSAWSPRRRLVLVSHYPPFSNPFSPSTSLMSASKSYSRVRVLPGSSLSIHTSVFSGVASGGSVK